TRLDSAQVSRKVRLVPGMGRSRSANLADAGSPKLGAKPADRVREGARRGMTYVDRIPTKERAHGRWRSILPALGIEERFLTGRNCPCPVCGGTDRFRYLDRKDRDGDGMWICSQCTPRARPALELVIKFLGKPFKDAAREIDIILGGADGRRDAPAPLESQ